MPLGIEDIIHQKFAAQVKQLELYNKLNCIWWSYDASGEKRSPITGSLLKSKGLNSGQADYHFITLRGDIAHIIYIEFKRPKIGTKPAGKQSENQIKFQQRLKASNIKYYLAYSVDEGIKILEKEGIIKYDN